MNPGPAVSKRSNIVPSRSRFDVIACAILKGGIRNAFAPAIAAFVAKSPWLLSAGVSMINGAASACGSSPFDIAFSIAFSIAFFSCCTASAYVSISIYLIFKLVFAHKVIVEIKRVTDLKRSAVFGEGVVHCFCENSYHKVACRRLIQALMPSAFFKHKL
jgi:hypothetical protein